MLLLNVKLYASESCLKLADPFLLSFCRASKDDSIGMWKSCKQALYIVCISFELLF